MENAGFTSEILEIHGFRVLSASPIAKGFKQVLKRLASRGYADPSCVIVKTKPGPKSGVIHAGATPEYNLFARGLTAISPRAKC